MNKIQKLFITLFALSGLLINFVAPVAAYEISGNNTDSDNYIDVDMDKDADVDQDNDADVENNITVSLSSGKNKVKDVSGGDVSIDTGDVEAGVMVENNLNTNMASVDFCDGCGVPGEFKIADNNSKTDNDIEYDYDSDVKVDQDNDADVENNVDVTAASGKNKVKSVVGGDVEIDTGNVKVNPVVIRNTLNSNWASVSSSGEVGDLSAKILGNNTKSANFIDLDVDKDTDVDQDNDADVESDVTVGAYSGKNEVKDIAGAGVSIDTGEVEVGILVDTMANFNFANVEDCCVLEDMDLKIADNNSKTDNDIKVKTDSDYDLDQDNDFGGGHGCCHHRGHKGHHCGHSCGGDVADIDVTGGSGENSVKSSTASGHDPEIVTGDVAAAVEVSTQANVNVDGNVDFDFPDMGDGGTSVDIDLDFGEIMDLLQDILGLLGA